MALAKGILDEQHITGSDESLFAITDFNFCFAGEKQDILAPRRRMPIAERRCIALRTCFFERKTMGINHPRKISVDAVFDAGFLEFVKM